MSESQTLLAEVNYIKNKVNAIEKVEILNLRSNKNLKSMYLDLFGEDHLLFDVYKLIDGNRNQRMIANELNANEMTVSRKIKILFDNGLIEIKEVVGKQRIYMHSVAEKAFGLSKEKL